jgi:FKBP-type peptidyl-prolyl cis-trans isomerase
MPSINQTEDVMKTASGLEYIEVEAGTGAQAEAGKTVSVHYTGKFQDGKVFDSSVSRGEPITFPLGAGRVIKGWDEGIALMKVGGKAQLVIPPHLAYGERGAGGVIPPNATLVFDVELVSVDKVDGIAF